MERITRHQMFMEMARAASKRSTCFRLNVGAIIVEKRRIVRSIGYNGQEPGEPHCTTPCGEGQCNTTHAEMNALRFLSDKLRLGGTYDLYVTASPCMPCASALSVSAIDRIFFEAPYRVTASIEYLVKSGREVYQLLPNGAMLNHNGRVVVVP